MGGLFSSKVVSLGGFRVDDRNDPEDDGELLPALSTSRDRNGDALPSLVVVAARFNRIEGGPDSGDEPSWDVRVFDRNPAWNRLDLVVGRLEVSGKVKEGLESEFDSTVLRR